MGRDWSDWHRGYDDPDSGLSQRLDEVVSAIRTAIDRAPIGSIRLISLCAGDARDICRALGDHPRRDDVTGCAIESDPALAAAASNALRTSAPKIQVRCCDAGDPRQWSDMVPTDVIVLAGIFGNVSDEDVQRTIASVPSMCRVGGSIVWTRHRREPDLTPAIASWFAHAGCPATSFASLGPSSHAVGSQVYLHPRKGPALDCQLFRFLDPS